MPVIYRDFENMTNHYIDFTSVVRAARDALNETIALLREALGEKPKHQQRREIEHKSKKEIVR